MIEQLENRLIEALTARAELEDISLPDLGLLLSENDASMGSQHRHCHQLA